MLKFNKKIVRMHIPDGLSLLCFNIPTISHLIRVHIRTINIEYQNSTIICQFSINTMHLIIQLNSCTYDHLFNIPTYNHLPFVHMIIYFNTCTSNYPFNIAYISILSNLFHFIQKNLHSHFTTKNIFVEFHYIHMSVDPEIILTI